MPIGENEYAENARRARTQSRLAGVIVQLGVDRDRAFRLAGLRRVPDAADDAAIESIAAELVREHRAQAEQWDRFRAELKAEQEERARWNPPRVDPVRRQLLGGDA